MHDPKYHGECVIIMDELLESLYDCFTKAVRGTQFWSSFCCLVARTNNNYVYLFCSLFISYLFPK